MAQRTTYPGASGTSQTVAETIVREKPFVKTYSIENPDAKEMLADTSLNGFEIYAPHRRFETAALTLGNLGSSARPIAFSERRNIFTDIGYHQYDIYRIEAENLAFYELNRPFNELYFSPQSGQQNFQVGARFSRNIGDNMNISIDYDRIKQEGFYSDQDTKMTSFGLGLSKRTDSHEMYLSFIANNFNEAHNGGVSENVDSLDRLSPVYRNQRSTIDTYLKEATGRHQYFSYSADNSWTPAHSAVRIHHHGRLEHGYFRYSDEETDSPEDSLVYKSYLTNDRGIRVVNKFRRLTNSVALGFQLKSFELEAGITHNYLYFNDSNKSEHIHDASLDGRLKFKLKNIASLMAKTQIAIGENAGNFLLDGKLDLELGSIGRFVSVFHTSRYDPYLIQENFIVTNKSVYRQELSKTNELSLSGELHLDGRNLSLKAKAGLVDKAVYYNGEAIPVQSTADIRYVQLSFKHSLFWKFIGLDNELIYQSFNTNLYQLPLVFSRHNAYLQKRFFKRKLNARLGIQYYNIDYNGTGLAFMPVNGAFYPSESPTRYYPITELYLNAQVERFRIFFRFDNFSDMLLPDVHYQVQDYPQFDARFRMGVNWIFFD